MATNNHIGSSHTNLKTTTHLLGQSIPSLGGEEEGATTTTERLFYYRCDLSINLHDDDNGIHQPKKPRRRDGK